jgi:hypothetical protein
MPTSEQFYAFASMCNLPAVSGVINVTKLVFRLLLRVPDAESVNSELSR